MMSEIELKSSAQWGKSLIPALNGIFNKLSDKIDLVNLNISDMKKELMETIGTAQKTADSALRIANELKDYVKEEFQKVHFQYENLKSENERLRKHANHLDNYSRKSNLVIGEIPENEGESAEQCEQQVRKFFKTN